MSNNTINDTLLEGKIMGDASPEIIAAIRSRVKILNDNLILVKELKEPSCYSADFIFQEMNKYASQFESCGFLIDIRESKIPDAKARRFINNGFKQICGNVKHVSFVSGRNIIVNTTAKFVMHQASISSFSFHETIEQGINKLQEKINI